MKNIKLIGLLVSVGVTSLVLIVGILIGGQSGKLQVNKVRAEEQARFTQLKELDDKLISNASDLISEATKGWNCQTTECYEDINENVDRLRKDNEILLNKRQQLIK